MKVYYLLFIVSIVSLVKGQTFQMYTGSVFKNSILYPSIVSPVSIPLDGSSVVVSEHTKVSFNSSGNSLSVSCIDNESCNNSASVSTFQPKILDMSLFKGNSNCVVLYLEFYVSQHSNVWCEWLCLNPLGIKILEKEQSNKTIYRAD